MDEFFVWYRKYKDLWKEQGVWEQIEEIANTLIEVVSSTEEADASEPADEQAEKSKWFGWWKGRKGD